MRTASPVPTHCSSTTSSILAQQRRLDACDIVGTVGGHELQLHSQDPRRILDILHDACHRVLAIRMGMPERSHAGEPGNDIFEQLQALRNQLRAEKGRPSNITARPC